MAIIYGASVKNLIVDTCYILPTIMVKQAQVLRDNSRIQEGAA